MEERLAQAEIDRSEAYQKLTDGPQPEDNLPVSLTFRQVQEIAAIVGAAQCGHKGYFDRLIDVTKFLNASAMGGAAGAGVRPAAAKVWAGIEDAPLPPKGAPRPQPDVDS